MLRRSLLFAALLAGVCAAPAPAQDPAAPQLASTVEACVQGSTPQERSVRFAASMPPLQAARTLAVRFALEVRRGNGPWRRTPAPTFDRWERSVPGAAGFVYEKTLMRLVAPAAYRVVVRFRWYDADGRIVRKRTRTSSACVQPDLSR